MGSVERGRGIMEYSQNPLNDGYYMVTCEPGAGCQLIKMTPDLGEVLYLDKLEIEYIDTDESSDDISDTLKFTIDDTNKMDVVAEQ